MFGNYIWPLIVLSLLATINALLQGSPPGLGIEPFSAINTTLTPESYNVKVLQTSTKIMISTGYPGNSATKKTVVIDLEDSNVICEVLDDFPMEIYVAVGANLASTPIICGGFFYNGIGHSSVNCFKYTKGGWQNFATLIERRNAAAGIVYKDALHIFGGYDQDANNNLQSSEIVKKDGSSTEGPQLPTPVYAHAIASINSTVSIITGGWTNTYSDQTWYFNHESQEFQQGPNLLEARSDHSSGSVTDQETKEKMAIIAGGFGIDRNLDSTEMLWNGEWKTGKTHTESCICLFLNTFS